MTKKLPIFVASLSLTACNAGNGKNDIIGFRTGMKKAEVHAFADSEHWKCENDYPRKNFSPTEETCYTLKGPMRVGYATNLDGWPVAALTFGFDEEHRGQGISLEIKAEDIRLSTAGSPTVWKKT